MSLIAHAGHPAEWLPFASPLLLVALVWLVIKARDAAADPGRDGEGEDAPGDSEGDSAAEAEGEQGG